MEGFAPNFEDQRTDKLAAALAKAQGEIDTAKKDASNPAFKRDGMAGGSKYATLASVWEACREALSKNAIAVVQAPAFEDGRMVLHTTLLHSSGQSLSCILPISAGQQATAQQVGSAITYARRYSLAAMVGVAPADDDDDGNAAVASGAPRQPTATTPKPPAPKAETGSFWKKAKLTIPFPTGDIPPEGQTYSKEALARWEATFLKGVPAAPSRALLAKYQTDNQHIIDLLPAERTHAVCEACREQAEKDPGRNLSAG